jgi:hypothetical protein
LKSTSSTKNASSSTASTASNSTNAPKSFICDKDPNNKPHEIKKAELSSYLKACKIAIPDFQGFVWGHGDGTLAGACAKAKDSAYDYPTTACYCYTAENVGSTSAVENGDLLCWVGSP